GMAAPSSPAECRGRLSASSRGLGDVRRPARCRGSSVIGLTLFSIVTAYVPRSHGGASERSANDACVVYACVLDRVNAVLSLATCRPRSSSHKGLRHAETVARMARTECRRCADEGSAAAQEEEDEVDKHSEDDAEQKTGDDGHIEYGRAALDVDVARQAP